MNLNALHQSRWEPITRNIGPMILAALENVRRQTLRDAFPVGKTTLPPGGFAERVERHRDTGRRTAERKKRHVKHFGTTIH